MLSFLCLMVFLVATEVAGVVKSDVALGRGEVRGKRSDDGGPLEVVVQQLTQQVNSLTAQLNQHVNELNAHLGQQDTKLTALEAKTGTMFLFVWLFVFLN